MSSRLVFSALAVIAGSWMGAEAAPATPDQAAAIKTSLERYLGRGPDGGSVTVTPNGESYTIAVDLKKTLHVLEAFGVVFEPATYTLTTSPLDDGTWHVTSGALPPLTLKFKEQTTSVVSNGQHFDGIYDPRIPAFTRYTSGYDSLSVGIVGKKVATQARQLNHGLQTETATAAGDGVVNARLSQTNADYMQEVAFDAPKAVKPGVPNRVSIKSGPTTESLAIDGLHVRALAELWAFLVAHPSVDAIKASQDDLRSVLRQALPLFQRWSQDGSLDKLSVESPVGHIGAQSASAHFDLTGLTSEGHANLSIKVDGLTTPTAALPAWTVDLVPTGFELKNSFSGYRLDQAAQEAVNAFDLNAPKPLTPEVMEKIRILVGPVDQMVVTIGASRITSPLIDARFEGEVHLTQAIPTYTVTVHATGMDKAIESIQAKAAGDPTAAQVIAGMMLVKGYGRSDTDGSLKWVITGDATGGVMVNNVQLPIGKGP